MKVYVSYVIQGKNGHSHESTFINVTCGPYNASSNPPISEALEWADKKQIKLNNSVKIIVTSVYKV